MSEEFEFSLGNKVLRTGLQTPETRPLTSFAQYPEKDLYDVDDCVRILTDPNRKRKRDWFQWILNQGGRSSCNAYAAVGAMRKARVANGHPDVEFAPEFVYAHINGGRDQGSMLDDGMNFISEHGCCTRGMVPYESYRDTGGIEAKRIAKGYRALCYALPQDSIENLWRAAITAVCRNQPIVLAVHVGNSFMNSGEFAGVNRGGGNHAIHADDAVITTDSPRSFMDFRLDHAGSWGKSWGDKGRSYLSPDHLREPMQYHAMYAVYGVIESPHDDSPIVAA